MSWDATRVTNHGAGIDGRPGARSQGTYAGHAPRRTDPREAHAASPAGPTDRREGPGPHPPGRADARDGPRPYLSRRKEPRGGPAGFVPAGTETWDEPGAGPDGGAGLLDGVRQWLAENGSEPTPARVAQALREQGRVLGDAEVLGAAERLRSELVGSGPLEPLLADPSVTDVLVSAPDRVWVDRGGGLELTPVSFPDTAAVRRLAQRLAAVAGRRLDDARPWVDARLPDGTRLHAVLPPVAVGSTCLSLRVVRPRAFTLDELVAAGTVPPGGDRVLRALLDARLSFLISGGTGSGNPNM